MFTAKMILHRDIANPRIKITRANDTRNNFVIKKKIRFSSLPLIFELSCKNVGRQTKPTDKQNFPISCSRFRTFAFFPRNRENERDCFPFFVPARNKSVVKRESTPVQSFNRARYTEIRDTKPIYHRDNFERSTRNSLLVRIGRWRN